jgi:hypothetical protein
MLASSQSKTAESFPPVEDTYSVATILAERSDKKADAKRRGFLPAVFVDVVPPALPLVFSIASRMSSLIVRFSLTANFLARFSISGGRVD